MFTEFTTQTFTPSAGSVVITDNTDLSIDGTSKKIVWTDGQNETCTIDFDAVTLSNYEELTFYLHQKQELNTGNIIKITIDGNDYNFETLNEGWNFIIIDCSGMGATSQIVIECLVENLTLFIDYIGYRKAGHDRDTDLILAIKNTISLSYGVTTTLSANAPAGSTSISLTSLSYIKDNSILQLDDGGGTTEEVELTSKSGRLKTAIANAFSSGDTVTVLCPVRGEDFDNMEPDPICGIVLYNATPDKEDTVIKIKDGYIHKVYTGEIGVMIYIDCSSKKKLMELKSQYDVNYGERFQMFLDGQKIDVYLTDSSFLDDEIGNNPRIAYYYNIKSQPYTTGKVVPITTINQTLEPKEP